MSDIRLLYFTSQDHRVYRWRGSRIELEASFPADATDLGDFSAFAKSTGTSRYYVLADLAGEDFHEETIPWLRGSDREAVIHRRLAQRYRDTRLAATNSLGAVAGERRNERVLLASFTNTQQFSPWLDALSEAGARLAGVYSAPFLAPALAAKLSAKLGTRSNRIFLVSLNSSGLRQSYVEDGQLRFSRLERTVEMGPEALSAFVRSETLRLYQYLGSLRVLPREGPPITAIIITPPGQQPAFENALSSDGRLTFRTIDLTEAARAIGLKQAEGANAEQLYLHLTVKKTPKAQFARSEDRRTYLLWQLQRGIVFAGAAGFAACAIYSGAKWLDVMTLREQVDQQVQQARTATREYERITSAFPVTQTSTDNLKVTVGEFQKIAARTASPEPAFVHLSKALEQFPQIELDGLVWRIDRPVPIKPTPGTTPATPAPGAVAKPATATDASLFLDISGRVTAAQRSDYRAITAQVQRFANALAADPAYQVVQTQLPFDITPEGTLSGDIGDNQGGDVPRFGITLARRLEK
jgi:hypothetical protein